MRLRLTAATGRGSVAGVVVGSTRTLDLVTLNRIRLRTFLGSGTNPVETRTGVSAVEVKRIGPNRYVLEFTTTADFDQVELGLGGLNDAIATLDVFYAYGMPQGATPVGPAFTSTFAAPVAGSEYMTSTTGICVLCRVSNPGRADDENLETNNYATLQTTVGAVRDTRLRLRLDGVAPAGAVAGLVLSTGSLIDLNVFATLPIRTYIRDANGNLVLQETAAGTNLLQLNLLTGNRYAIGFTSTRPLRIRRAIGRRSCIGGQHRAGILRIRDNVCGCRITRDAEEFHG
ncbi:MAG: hypothetical protein H7330_15485 [Hymenobacteraceae bacterium]|nr:hypothetical protein [Hymenobacteraceae bacterium]